MPDNAPEQRIPPSVSARPAEGQSPGGLDGPASHPGSTATEISLPHQSSAPPPSVSDHELLRRIGGGSYGEVWLARSVMGTYRAVKVVYRATFKDERPFEREFAGLQKFEPISRSHEGLVDLLQVGRSEQEGYFYYVMELADDANDESTLAHPADTLSHPTGEGNPQSAIHDPQSYTPHTLKSNLQGQTRLPLDECIQLGLSLTSALAYLHGQGLVHRDIKPSNIIFVGRVPKLADAGLVVGVGETRSYVGTEGFMPPEGPGSPQADVYSLGIVLYQMSTGKSHQDFPEPLADLAAQADHDRWLEFNAVIHKACRAEVRERYQSAEEMHAELALLEGGQSVKRKRVVERRFAVAKKIGFAAATVAIAATLLFYASVGLLRRNVVPQAQINSIAVLPFTIDPPNQADQFLSEALPEQLIHTLTSVHGLKVASANSSFALRDRQQDARRIGAQLKVRTLLGGAIRKSDNRLKIVATLINVSDGARLWAKDYDCEMKDLPACESDIAQRVASSLTGPLSTEQRTRITKPLTENPEAYRLYLEGSYFLHRWSEASIDPAIELLEQAAKLDPKFAAVQADLAQAYVQKAFTFDAQQRWQAKASAAIATALALDPNCAEAFLARSMFLWTPWSGFQHELAVKDLRRALALDANLAEAYQLLAMVYVHVGLFDKAREASRQALELDPLNVGAPFREGVANLYEGRYLEALKVFERVPASFQSALLTMQTATTLFYLGQTKEAKSRLEGLLAKKPDDALLHSLRAVLFAAGGETNKAQQEILRAGAGKQVDLGHYHHVSYNIASAYALMKDNASALEALRKAAKDGYPCYPRFEKDRNLDNLRGDPQFRLFMDDLRRKFEEYKNTL